MAGEPEVATRFVRLAGDELRASPDLQVRMREIVAPFYVDPSAILQRGIVKCTDGYFGFLAHDIHAFFLVQWGTADRVYLGLSATSIDARRSGLVHRLYEAFLADARAWEATHARRLLLWGTTASPSAVRVVQTVFSEAIPSVEGDFSDADAAVARELAASLEADAHGGHPFVLRSVATATRYAAAEAERNDRYARSRGVDLLEKLGVREDQGDRLLFLCRVPTHLDAIC